MVFDPLQGTYRSTGTHGNSKKFLLETIEERLDKFILDYLESNLKYEATLKDKKLRDIDRVIKDAADADANKIKIGTLSLDDFIDLEVNPFDGSVPGHSKSQTAWYKRYNALMKEK